MQTLNPASEPQRRFAMRPTPPQLARAWNELRDRNPRTGLREAASQLGSSEGEIVAARCTGPGGPVFRLRRDWNALLTELNAAAPLRLRTRNRHAGLARRVTTLPTLRDLYAAPGQWHEALVIREEDTDPGRPQSRVCIFAPDGTPVLTLERTPHGDAAAWERVLRRLAAVDQRPGMTVTISTAPGTRPDTAVDCEALRDAWDLSRHPDTIHELSACFQCTPEQTLRLAGPERAWPVGQEALDTVLMYAAEDALGLRIELANQGVRQQYSGPVTRLAPTRTSFNILDPDFSLNIRRESIAGTWVFRRPASSGARHGLALFAPDGETIIRITDASPAGHPEDPRWRALLGLFDPLPAAPRPGALLAKPRFAMMSRSADVAQQVEQSIRNR
ncbi:ChuX/HutX family heme-like substrate-binding protein [Thioalkalivibrio sp. ALE11]|uniref:ChuX/HutX family heme-like substrate-binding protein n=1 Tax=Thioalkalivibrio sp. ALE11 TaxID=1265494 RepID=UPI0012DBF39C